MRKNLPGFTFIEVLLYIALFSLLATALFTFSWDMLKLSRQGDTERLVTGEARFAVERMKYSLRRATGIDGSSVFENTSGKLVLDLMGTSDTLTFELQGGQIVMQQSGQSAVPLHSQDLRATSLWFERSTAADQSVEYVKVQATFETVTAAPAEYDATLTLETGATLRNLGL